MHDEFDATMIYVTHDQVEAMTLADKIVVLNGGVVEQYGSPLELYHHPQNLFVAGFIGSPKMNFLDGEVQSVTNNAVTVSLLSGEQVVAEVATPDAKPGEKVTLGLRPEHLIDGGQASDKPSDAEIKGKAIAVEHLGGETYAYLDRGGSEPLVLKTDGDAKIGIDETVPVGIRSQSCYLFDKDGRAFQRARAA